MRDQVIRSLISVMGLLGLAGAAVCEDRPAVPPAPVSAPVLATDTMTTPALPFPEPDDLKPIPDPDPLVFLDGRKVKTNEDWEARKQEILDLAHHYIYGFCGPEQLVKGTPPPEVVKEVKDAYGGLATMHEIKVPICPDANDPKGVLWLALAIPNKGKGPFPTVLQFKRPKEAHAETQPPHAEQEYA